MVESAEQDREGLTPEEAFAILGDKTRVAILQALAAAEREQRDNQTCLAFSELYDRVEANNTSQFSYHLNRLSGRFVEKTDEGYTLTYAGEKIVRAILAGTYNERIEFDQVELAGRCLACGADRLEAIYDEFLEIRCSTCEVRLITCLLSPQQVRNRTPKAVLESCDADVRAEYDGVLDGVCRECSGLMDASIHRVDEPVDPIYLHVSECRGCGHTISNPVEIRAFYHPAVVAFYWKHGTDLTQLPIWKRLDHVYSDRWHLDVCSEEPFVSQITITLADEQLHLDIEGDTLAVTRVERVQTRET